MRRNRLIVVAVAMLGVLLHAGLLVRHGGMTIQKQFLNADLAAAGSVICHSDGTTEPGRPIAPGSTDQGDCPLCQGMMTAAVLPAAAPDISTFASPSSRLVMIAARIATRLEWLSPPPRGPPAFPA